MLKQPGTCCEGIGLNKNLICLDRKFFSEIGRETVLTSNSKFMKGERYCFAIYFVEYIFFVFLISSSLVCLLVERPFKYILTLYIAYDFLSSMACLEFLQSIGTLHNHGQYRTSFGK